VPYGGTAVHGMLSSVDRGVMRVMGVSRIDMPRSTRTEEGEGEGYGVVGHSLQLGAVWLRLLLLVHASTSSPLTPQTNDFWRTEPPNSSCIQAKGFG
jgi:hypothetical protein